MLLKADKKNLTANRKEAVNILRQAISRENKLWSQPNFLAGTTAKFSSLLTAKLNTLDQFGRLRSTNWRCCISRAARAMA